MHKPSSLRDYVIAFLIAGTVTVLLGYYLTLRHGFFFDAPPTADPFYVPNRTLANAALILIALTFLIGPIVRYFDRFDTWLGYRKEIGIVGMLLVTFHAFGSYLFLPIKFPREYMLEDPFFFMGGLIAFIILVILFVTSLKKVIELLGGGPWWFLQRWGLRLVILFSLVHIFALRWEGWWRWFTVGAKQTPDLLNPLLPPASLLAAVFASWVTIIRLYESIFTGIGPPYACALSRIPYP